MVAGRQTWYWRRNQEVYICIHRQQDGNEISEAFSIKATSTPKRLYLLIVPAPKDPWEPFFTQTTTWILAHIYNPCTGKVETGGFLGFAGQPGRSARQVPGQDRTSLRKKGSAWGMTLRECSLAFQMPEYTQKTYIKLRDLRVVALYCCPLRCQRYGGTRKFREDSQVCGSCFNGVCCSWTLNCAHVQDYILSCQLCVIYDLSWFTNNKIRS